ncbi:MAG: AtpZ/AtpI family protein [Chitinophagales bacterium]|nr:AtpZ/AtpI family protein [Bacteroidota bacterium]
MNNSYKKWLLYSGMAIEMFVVIGICTALGVYVDKKCNLSPVFTLTFLLLGMALTFYHIYKQLNQLK